MAAPILAGAQIGLQLLQSFGQARALEAQGRYQKTISEINARNAERQAADALKRGATDVNVFRKKVKQIVGTQRTSFAAQGVDVGYGSAQAIQDETYELAAEQVETIQNNAFLEAMGFKQQAFNATQAGFLASEGAKNEAMGTLLTGGIKTLGMGVDNFGGAGLKKGV